MVFGDPYLVKDNKTLLSYIICFELSKINDINNDNYFYLNMNNLRNHENL